MIEILLVLILLLLLRVFFPGWLIVAGLLLVGVFYLVVLVGIVAVAMVWPQVVLPVVGVWLLAGAVAWGLDERERRALLRERERIVAGSAKPIR